MISKVDARYTCKKCFAPKNKLNEDENYLPKQLFDLIRMHENFSEITWSAMPVAIVLLYILFFHSYVAAKIKMDYLMLIIHPSHIIFNHQYFHFIQLIVFSEFFYFSFFSIFALLFTILRSYIWLRKNNYLQRE